MLLHPQCPRKEALIVPTCKEGMPDRHKHCILLPRQRYSQWFGEASAHMQSLETIWRLSVKQCKQCDSITQPCIGRVERLPEPSASMEMSAVNCG